MTAVAIAAQRDSEGHSVTNMSEVQRSSLKALVTEQCKRLEQLGITYWLDRGTLLGAAREGGIMAWDNDEDLAMLQEDASKVWNNFETLEKDLPEGMTAWKVNYGDVPYFSFGLHGEHSDVTQSVKTSDGQLTDPYGGAHISTSMTRFGNMTRQIYTLKRDIVLPTQQCTFEGFDGCQCPNNVSAYLASQYGPKWYIPVPRSDEVGHVSDVASAMERELRSCQLLTDEMKEDLKAALAKLTKAI